MKKNTIIALLVVGLVGAYLIRKSKATEVYADPATMSDDELYKEFLKTYWSIRTESRKLSNTEKERWESVLKEINKRGRFIEWVSKAQNP